MKRYFYITFASISKSGNTGIGDCCSITFNGSFFNKKNFIKDMIEKNDLSTINILSIIELSEKDYESFNE